MCIDFTDLNRAYPKDHYPFPSIDRLVNVTVGHAVCFLVDAISGYHQIMIEELDAKKTAFITDEGVFYYKVMPFGLKNKEATY